MFAMVKLVATRWNRHAAEGDKAESDILRIDFVHSGLC